MNEPIELHPAYVWDCDACGVENFCRSVALELDPEEEKELREEHGIEPWDQGDWCMAPKVVTCRECGAEYSTLCPEDDE